MSILEELRIVMRNLYVPCETGVFSEPAPDTYAVIVPISDIFALHADNRPGVDIQEARISLYTKGSYTGIKNRLVNMLVARDFTITDRRYNGYEPEAGYHHYVVDAAKYYEYETEEE